MAEKIDAIKEELTVTPTGSIGGVCGKICVGFPHRCAETGAIPQKKRMDTAHSKEMIPQ